MRAVEDVRRCRGERRLRLLGLLDQRDHAIVLVELDDAIPRSQLETADVVDDDGARLALAVPPGHVLRKAVVEQVVAGDHQQVLVAEPGAIDDELNVADRAKPVVLARRPVVVHAHVV